MDAESVVEIFGTLENASIRVWLDGGWGVDALLGEQTRAHADLDIILDAVDVARLEAVLRPLGFHRKPESFDASFVLADARGREIDVHPVGFDDRGWAVFVLADGRRWRFPPPAFAGRGAVAGYAVRCLSAQAQVQCHGQGYEPTENDLRDMAIAGTVRPGPSDRSVPLGRAKGDTKCDRTRRAP
jgi:lincosamide nucleotidyltransferase A/C/D/E